MKKSKFIIFLLVFIFTLSSCGTSANKEDPVDTESNSALEQSKTSAAEEIDKELENEKNETTEESSAETEKKWYFLGTDLEGNKVDSKEVFAEADLTLVNIWATYCEPCKVELPDLAELSRNYSDKNIKVLGIAADVYHDSPQTIELAEEILKEAGAEYLNITANDQIENNILRFLYAVPTTLFVDSNGDVLGETLIGTKSYDEFVIYIDAALKESK